MPKGILISRDDNGKKYRVSFELPAYNYLELREYPIEAIVLTIVPEEKSETWRFRLTEVSDAIAGGSKKSAHSTIVSAASMSQRRNSEG